MAERDVRIRFTGEAKALKGTMAEVRQVFAALVDDSDDARSAAQKLGEAYTLQAEKTKAEMAQLETASMAVADSLGPEMVQALEKSGQSVEGLVAEWRRLGLTYDDITSESDALAAGLKNLDSAGRRAGEEVGAGLEKIHDGADQSRSVLANMVGNSAQDIGELAGVSGSAGVMLGQLAEYAADGNIALGNLARVAGPLAAVGLGVAAITSVMEENARQQQFLQDQTRSLTEALIEAQKSNHSATTSIVSDWEQAGKIEAQISNATATMVEFGQATDDMAKIHELRFPTAQKATIDFAAEIDKLGMSAEEFAELAQKPVEGIQAWGREMEASGADAKQVNLVMQGAMAVHVRLGEAQRNAAVWARVFSSAEDEVGTSARGALPSLQDLTEAGHDYADAQKEAEQATRDANDALRAKIDKDFAAYDAQQRLIQSTQDLLEAKDDEKTLVNEVDQAQKDYVRSAIDAASAIADQAEAQAAAKGETMSAKEKQDLFIQSLEDTAKTLDPNSPVRKMLDEYIAALLGIPKNIDTLFRINGVQVPFAGLNSPSGVVVPGVPGRAAGGPVSAGRAYIVGEQGPELVVPSEAGSVVPADTTARMMAGGGEITVVIKLEDDELKRITVRQDQLRRGQR